LIQRTARLEVELGYTFSDPELLHRALTHRSVGNNNNERLEFLGDAVLGCVIADELFHNFPHVAEGRLSRLRSSLVRRETLAEIGKQLGIGDFLQLGPGERKSGGHRRESILSDALEAIFGAIYLDGGLEAASTIVERFLEEALETRSRVAQADAKTRLQEVAQARGWGLPDYSVVAELGPDHRKSFTVECSVDGRLMGAAEGRSKKVAEQGAAAVALERLDLGGDAP